MEEMRSEEELMQGQTLGQWKFSLSKEEIDSRLASLPKLQEDKDSQYWSKLFSLVQEHNESSDHETPAELPNFQNNAETPMECSSVLESEDTVSVVNDAEGRSIEDLTICLVDLCNQVAPKLKFGLSIVQEEVKSFTEDVCKLRGNLLAPVMMNAWTQLSSDASKLCFCIPFASNAQTCKKLCEVIIKPWLSKRPPSKLEQLSAIFSAESETVCRDLVAPLLKIENSPLAQDTMSLEELMTSMVDKHWTTLLKELLSDMKELPKWQIPSLATIVEHAKPSVDEAHLLVQLMSSTGTTFAQSRDFGALLVAVAKSLDESDTGLVSQLKLVANNYKGPLKFKALKILKED